MDSLDPRLGMGGNNPPTPFETLKDRFEDIRLEAGNFMDGTPITSIAEAKAVERIQALLKAAMADAEAAKDEEKKPFKDAADEIQDRYNTLIGKTQKVTGVALVMEATIKTALTAWRNKLEQERQEEARRLAQAADDQARLAREAYAAANGGTDLAQREEVLEAIREANQAQAKAVSASKAHTKGLRTVYDIEVLDPKALAAWFWSYRKEELVSFMTDEARKLVRASSGNTTIAGVKVLSEKVAF